jgi:Cation transport protein
LESEEDSSCVWASGGHNDGNQSPRVGKKTKYSLSGAMGRLSKSTICTCIVMLSGRHRGLPVALDRAITFPAEIVHKISKKVDEIMLKRHASPRPLSLSVR